ncbi:MAG: hypothetical protein OXN18_02765 [Gemmatimonadota bacterium]|nr:hypothetical protein [Gemmatimonadota bacterium]
MNNQTKRLFYNVVTLIESLEPDERITRKALIEHLRRRVPVDIVPSEPVLRHAYRHLVLNSGIKNAGQAVTYRQAAALAKTTVSAIRQAAYRGDVIKLTVYRYGREWSGVTLRSLAEWRGWSQERFKAAARRVEGFADSETDSGLLKPRHTDYRKEPTGMADGVEYQYLSEEEAERRARIYRTEIDPSAVALSFGKRGWAVAVRPGWRLCEACDGFGWTGDDRDRPCEDCVTGWRRVQD